MRRRLEDALREAVPKARVMRLPAGSVDRDFYRMVHAPYLLTAGGSYAAIAAAASYATLALSPAANNLNAPHQLMLSEESLAPNWHTYSYTMLNTSGLQRTRARDEHHPQLRAQQRRPHRVTKKKVEQP